MFYFSHAKMGKTFFWHLSVIYWRNYWSAPYQIIGLSEGLSLFYLNLTGIAYNNWEWKLTIWCHWFWWQSIEWIYPKRHKKDERAKFVRSLYKYSEISETTCTSHTNGIHLEIFLIFFNLRYTQEIISKFTRNNVQITNCILFLHIHKLLLHF